MKGRVIVLDAPDERASSAALIVDGRLEDLVLGAPEGSELPNAGDICVVRVKRKLPRAGAFCDMAGGRDGYLREAQAVREGERILAQVVSLPEPGKAVTLTTRLLVKGPRLILTPGAPGVNVSRRIGNAAERERLEGAVRAALAENPLAPGPDEMGVIVRTAARDEDARDLARELNCLVGSWTEHTALLRSNAGLVHRSAGSALNVALREWLFPRPVSILCEPRLARRLSENGNGCGPAAFFGDESFPPLLRREADPFGATGIHDAIDGLESPEVALGGGASMIVESTRALVAVDVNTGADFSPAAGLKANLAAARELPRQLRLRGLGGKIVLDLAPMPKKDRRRVEEALRKAVRDDPVETSLVGWTGLGLYELQRKRERRPLAEVISR